MPEKELVIVEDGEPGFYLKLKPWTQGNLLRESIDDCNHYLGRSLKSSPVWSLEPCDDLYAITLELRTNTDLEDQAFRIETSEAGINLVASNATSLDYAVTWFLETYFNIRWLWPGQSGEVVPKATRITVPFGMQEHRPDFLWRRFGFGGAFWQAMDPELAAKTYCGITSKTIEEMDAWHRRRRMGGLHIADGHRWSEICSPLEYGREHPEYFALVDGRRDAVYFNGKHENQPCTSNKEVINLVADYLIEQFRARPDLDGYSISLNDGLGYCECDACLSVDEWATDGHPHQHIKSEMDCAVQEWLGDLDAPEIPDRIMKFANDVAEIVTKRYPDKLILMLAYGVYRTAPIRVTLHPNILVQFCSMSWSWVDPKLWQEESQLLDKIGESANHLGIYDYLANGANGSMPRGCARTLHQFLQRFYQSGGRYYATQPGWDFATGGFTYYLLSRTLWNINSQFEDILNDYCSHGFGQSASIIYQYLQAWCDRWEQTQAGRVFGDLPMEQLVSKLYPIEWRNQRRTELECAIQAATRNPQVVARVMFLKSGMVFLDYLIDACHAIESLVDEGLNPESCDTNALRRWFSEDPGRVDAANNALAKRAELFAWVDQHRNQFVVAELWFDYQRLCRNGWLGPTMDRVMEVLKRLPVTIHQRADSLQDRPRPVAPTSIPIKQVSSKI